MFSALVVNPLYAITNLLQQLNRWPVFFTWHMAVVEGGGRYSRGYPLQLILWAELMSEQPLTSHHVLCLCSSCSLSDRRLLSSFRAWHSSFSIRHSSFSRSTSPDSTGKVTDEDIKEPTLCSFAKAQYDYILGHEWNGFSCFNHQKHIASGPSVTSRLKHCVLAPVSESSAPKKATSALIGSPN